MLSDFYVTIAKDAYLFCHMMTLNTKFTVSTARNWGEVGVSASNENFSFTIKATTFIILHVIV